MNTCVIALDLEGTLISNAVSVIPRPGLRCFVEACLAAAPEVAMFSSVSPDRVRQDGRPFHQQPKRRHRLARVAVPQGVGRHLPPPAGQRAAQAVDSPHLGRQPAPEGFSRPPAPGLPRGAGDRQIALTRLALVERRRQPRARRRNAAGPLDHPRDGQPAQRPAGRRTQCLGPPALHFRGHVRPAMACHVLIGVRPQDRLGPEAGAVQVPQRLGHRGQAIAAAKAFGDDLVGLGDGRQLAGIGRLTSHPHPYPRQPGRRKRGRGRRWRVAGFTRIACRCSSEGGGAGVELGSGCGESGTCSRQLATWRRGDDRLARSAAIVVIVEQGLPVSPSPPATMPAGLQFCPLCLASDNQPYFRRHWRLASQVHCRVHLCRLADRCVSCGCPVMVLAQRSLAAPFICGGCGADLRAIEPRSLGAVALRVATCIDDLCRLEHRKGLLAGGSLIEGILALPSASRSAGAKPLIKMTIAERIACFAWAHRRLLEVLGGDPSPQVRHWRTLVIESGGLMATLSSFRRMVLRPDSQPKGARGSLPVRRAYDIGLYDVLVAYGSVAPDPAGVVRRPR